MSPHRIRPGSPALCPLPQEERKILGYDRKSIAAFFLKVILFYALLMIPWPGVREGYAYLFRVCGNTVFRTFGSAGRVYFAPISPVPGGKDAKDTSVTLENIQTRGARGTMDMNSRLMGYLPTAFAAALILATPVPWSRRLWALLWGFGGFELALRLLDAFSDKNVLAVFSLGPVGKALIVILMKVLAMSPVSAYIAPIFVWILVTFRRGDWAKLLASSTTPHRANS